MFNSFFEEVIGAAALGLCFYAGQKKGHNDARLVVDQEYMQRELEELRKTVAELKNANTNKEVL